jgi:plasmid maintenance system antidote protein VapI
LRDVEQRQLTLLPERKPSRPVALEHIGVLKSTKQALEYACQLADVTPKEVCLDMECDKGTWSRICSGEWDIDGRDIPRLNRVLGNSAYLLYLNHVDGWDLASLRKVQDDKDREIVELRQQLADQDRAIRLMVEYTRSGRVT